MYFLKKVYIKGKKLYKLKVNKYEILLYLNLPSIWVMRLPLIVLAYTNLNFIKQKLQSMSFGPKFTT